MKRTGFTLIELMIVVAIIGIVVSLVLGAMTGMNGSSSTSVDLTPTRPYPGAQSFFDRSEVQCVNGKLFEIGANRTANEMKDSAGNPVKC